MGIHCNIGHLSEERLKFVYEKKLCVNCLQAGHFAYRCVRETTCSVAGCGRKHTRFLHQPKFRSDLVGRPDHNSSNKVKPESGVSDDKPRSFDEARCNRTGVGTGLCKSGRIALPIVPVKVYSSSGGNFVQTHALLDSGSTNTFCSMELIQMLGVQGRHEELSLTTLDKEKNTVDTVVVSLVVSDQAEHNLVKLPKLQSFFWTKLLELFTTKQCVITFAQRTYFYSLSYTCIYRCFIVTTVGV